FASNLPILPVPTFDALSLQISTYVSDDNTFCIANNANIEEFYFAKYKMENSKIVPVIAPSLKKKTEIDILIDETDNVFGNLKNIDNLKEISSPTGFHIAKWSHFYGQDLLTFEYDYLEPNYLKKFKVKNLK
ncbi:MAG: hypothetical protein GY936_13630, partial [Ignavibacteriae bacterium]|nr:hypothetical protein [Ignavibacteriota bacterium]